MLVHHGLTSVKFVGQGYGLAQEGNVSFSVKSGSEIGKASTGNVARKQT